MIPICGTCVSKEHCAVAECSHYEKQLKQTNADRIRCMSDEELANWHSTVSCNKWHSAIDWLEWLKQEVSDDS